MPEPLRSPPATRNERSLAGLFTDLLHDTQSLVHKEMELLRWELSEKVGKVGTGLGSLLASLVILFSGLLVLLAAAVFGLATVMALWLAALIVGAVVLGIGAFFFLLAVKRLKAGSLVPSATLQQLRRDREFIKEQWR